MPEERLTKKARLNAETAVLKRLIADGSGKKGKGERGSVPSLEAVQSLAAAACASRVSTSSGSAVPCTASTRRETSAGQAENGFDLAPTVAASLRTRNRPTKGTCHTSAKAAAAAVQALLRGQTFGVGGEAAGSCSLGLVTALV